MGFFLVMKAEMVRNFIIMRRYWFRSLTGLFIGYAMLLMLVVGFSYNSQAVGGFATGLAGQNATNVALGLIIGMFAFGIVGMFSQGLQELAQSGQLEQLCMSPHGLVTNFMARSLVASVSSILTSALMVWLIAKSVSFQLQGDIVATLVLLTLTYVNLIGFGFMVGGLVLVFKQTGQIAVLIRMALLALGVLATDQINAWPLLARWLAHILPVTDAAICLKFALIQGGRVPLLDDAGEPLLNELGVPVTQLLSVYAHPSFFLLLINCVIWTLIGISCFKVMENWSRSKGTLGAY